MSMSSQDIHGQLARVAAKQRQEQNRDAVVQLALDAVEPLCRIAPSPELS